MNKTSTDKIKSAAPFLIWFRQCLPRRLQGKVRPYLDRPYQLALKVLDCCDATQPLTVREIAQLAGVAQETARQVLQSLKEGGMPFAVIPTRGWQIVPRGDAFSVSPASLSPHLNPQESISEYVIAIQE